MGWEAEKETKCVGMCFVLWGFPGGSGAKNPPANAGDMGSIPGSGRSPGGGHGLFLPRIFLPQEAAPLTYLTRPGGSYAPLVDLSICH